MKKHTQVISIIILLVFLALFFVFYFNNNNIKTERSLKIVAFGDSLTEGLGVSDEDNYPAQLAKKLKEKGGDVEMINLGISGDTSADALARIDSVLEEEPDIVILVIGANDALRGIKVELIEDSISQIISVLHDNNIEVLLVGMRVLPGRGFEYSRDFKQLYIDLSKQYDVVFMPFFLDGIVARPDLNIDDGFHPNRQGYEKIVDNLCPYLVRLINKKFK